MTPISVILLVVSPVLYCTLYLLLIMLHFLYFHSIILSTCTHTVHEYKMTIIILVCALLYRLLVSIMEVM